MGKCLTSNNKRNQLLNANTTMLGSIPNIKIPHVCIHPKAYLNTFFLVKQAADWKKALLLGVAGLPVGSACGHFVLQGLFGRVSFAPNHLCREGKDFNTTFLPLTHSQSLSDHLCFSVAIRSPFFVVA